MMASTMRCSNCSAVRTPSPVRSRRFSALTMAARISVREGFSPEENWASLPILSRKSTCCRLREAITRWAGACGVPFSLGMSSVRLLYAHGPVGLPRPASKLLAGAPGPPFMTAGAGKTQTADADEKDVCRMTPLAAQLSSGCRELSPVYRLPYTVHRQRFTARRACGFAPHPYGWFALFTRMVLVVCRNLSTAGTIAHPAGIPQGTFEKRFHRPFVN